MRLGIIGFGRLGRVLARRFADLGHDVLVGTRACGDDDARRVDRLTFTSPWNAAGADVVFLAVPGEVAAQVASSLGDLEGRVLVDCTNGPRAGRSSLAERVARASRRARVVKALNLLDARLVAEVDLREVRPLMPLCGDEPEALAVVADLLLELGFQPMPCGDLPAARMLEEAGRLRREMTDRGFGAYVALGLVQVDRAIEERTASRRQTRASPRRVR